MEEGRREATVGENEIIAGKGERSVGGFTQQHISVNSLTQANRSAPLHSPLPFIHENHHRNLAIVNVMSVTDGSYGATQGFFFFFLHQ